LPVPGVTTVLALVAALEEEQAQQLGGARIERPRDTLTELRDLGSR